MLSTQSISSVRVGEESLKIPEPPTRTKVLPARKVGVKRPSDEELAIPGPSTHSIVAGGLKPSKRPRSPDPSATAPGPSARASRRKRQRGVSRERALNVFRVRNIEPAEEDRRDLELFLRNVEAPIPGHQVSHRSTCPFLEGRVG